MSDPFAHLNQPVSVPPIPEETPQAAAGLLPPAFQFSQQSLQDYLDCKRRFQLRYVEGKRWPAAESEPIEEREHFMEQGTLFHLMVQRYLSGVPAEKLTPADPLLAEWWQAFLEYPPQGIPEVQMLPEVALSTPVGEHRLLGRFDLLAIEPGERAVIVDWKTSRSRPSRSILASRMQTKIYPFVLVEAGAHLFGGDLQPEQVEMMYWFTASPTQPEAFTYDSAQHAENRDLIHGTVAEITASTQEPWPLTEHEFHCKYCVYRSLCDRGIRAGSLEEAEQLAQIPDPGDSAFTVDLDEVEEIAF